MRKEGRRRPGDRTRSGWQAGEDTGLKTGRWLAGGLGLLLAASASIGVVAPMAAAAGHVHLTLWSGFEPKEINVIRFEANQWAKRTGNSVTVLPNPGSFQSFATAAASGKGPDVVIGLPHDNLGPFVAAKLLAPVPKGTIDTKAYVPGAISAVTFGHTMYAIPISVESYALFYNKKLVKTPPKTFTQLIAMARSMTHGGQYGFVYDITNFYYSYAVIRGFGSYLFGGPATNPDPGKIGLDDAAGVKALAFLGSLVTKDHLMPPDINTTSMEQLFSRGKAAMIIDGPWDVNGYLADKIDLGVAPLPKLPNGHDMVPFSGVYTAFVSAMSKHQALDWQLIRYILQYGSVALYQAGQRIPAVSAMADSKTVTDNPYSRVFAYEVRHAEPMPKISAMATVWTPAQDAIDLVITGRESPAAAAAKEVQQLHAAIAQAVK